MLTAYGKLITVHDDIFKRGDHKPQLVIVLDEPAILREVIVTPSYRYLPSEVLCRAISCYSTATRCPIWVVFASTGCNIIEFSVPNVKCKWRTACTVPPADGFEK
jgi:hypothetical protein